MKKLLLISACLIMILLIIFNIIMLGRPTKLTSDAPPPKGISDTSAGYSKSLFSWDTAAIDPSQQAGLFMVMEALEIDRLYQEIPDDLLYSDTVSDLLVRLHAFGAEPYYLAGKAEWGLDETARQMKLRIDTVAAFNRTCDSNQGFSGIIFDVEPYLTEEWDQSKQSVLDSWTAAMKSAYNYATQKQIRVIICLPNWIDRTDESALKVLIEECCDEVAIMNYNRKNEIPAIEQELSIAQAAGKPLDCVFEFQAVGKHSLTENETYGQLGLAPALESFETLRSHYGYDQIGFSYHYLNPVLELLTTE